MRLQCLGGDCPFLYGSNSTFFFGVILHAILRYIFDMSLWSGMAPLHWHLSLATSSNALTPLLSIRQDLKM